MKRALTLVLLLALIATIQFGCGTSGDAISDAENKLSRGQLASARQILEREAESDSTGAVERYRRGLIREYHGLKWEAMITYLEGAPMGNGYYRSMDGFIRMTLENNYLPKGLQMAGMMVRLYPEDPHGYLYSARIFSHMHMHDSVTKYFDLAETKGVDADDLFLARTEYTFLTGSEEDIVDMQKQISVKSFSGGALCSRVACLYKMINFGDSALVYARKAVADDGRNIDYRLQLAQYLFDERYVFSAEQEIDRIREQSEKCSRTDLLDAYIAHDLRNDVRGLKTFSAYIDDNRQSPEATEKQGDFLVYQKNLRGANIQYQTAYTQAGNMRYPDDFLTYLFVKLENSMFDDRDVSTAYAYYKEAIDRYPGLEELDFFTAELVLRYPEVADSAKIIVDDNLDKNWVNGAWLDKASRFYYRTNRHEQAARVLGRLLELPQAKPAYVQKLYDVYEKLNDYESIVRVSASLPLRIKRDIGLIERLRDIHLDNGNTDPARSLSLELYNRCGEYVPFIKPLAQQYVADGQTDEARALFTGFVETWPGRAESQYQYALFEFEIGQNDEADKQISKTLDIDSTYSAAMELRGRILENSGDLNNALDEYRKVAMLRGASPYSYYRLARFFADTKDSLLRAEGLAKSAIVYFDKDTRGYTTLGDIYLVQEKYKLARTQFSQAARLDPESADIQFMLGKTAFLSGEKDLSRNGLEKALNLGLDDTRAKEARIMLRKK